MVGFFRVIVRVCRYQSFFHRFLEPQTHIKFETFETLSSPHVNKRNITGLSNMRGDWVPTPARPALIESRFDRVSIAQCSNVRREIVCRLCGRKYLQIQRLIITRVDNDEQCPLVCFSGTSVSPSFLVLTLLCEDPRCQCRGPLRITK